MDQFELAGIDLTPEAKQRLAQAIANLQLTIDQVIRVLRDWHARQELSGLNLASFGLRAQDLNVRDLPKTSSKGHWRDVVPRALR